MSAIPTPAEAEKFLDLFFDLELANQTLVEQDPDLGEILETTRLHCIIPEKNARKFYHITLYEYGYIAHYGRLDDDMKPKYKSEDIKKFPYRADARKAYDGKVHSKRFPSGKRDRYVLLGVDDLRE